MKDVNIAIKNQIEKSRLTQEQIAAVIGIPRTAIISIINGTRQVSANECLEFCKLFNVEPNVIMGWQSLTKSKEE